LQILRRFTTEAQRAQKRGDWEDDREKFNCQTQLVFNYLGSKRRRRIYSLTGVSRKKANRTLKIESDTAKSSSIKKKN
jgi:hypothetical protein